MLGVSRSSGRRPPKKTALANREAKAEGDAEPAADAEGPVFESREAFATWCEESVDLQDWYEAIRRWRRYRQHYPSDVWGYVKEAIALANIRAYVRAEGLVQTAETQFPDTAPVQLAIAEIATLQRNFGRAVVLWHELRERHPELPWGALRRDQITSRNWPVRILSA